MSIPTKTTQTCSNTFLIDENLCLSNSLNIINYNVSSLSSALVSLENYQQNWASLYTSFQANSSIWMQCISNVQTFSSKWISFSTTVQNLSSSWNKPFTVYYPTMQELNYWNSLSASNTQQSSLSSWLRNNFPESLYNNNQIINVTVYIYEAQTVPVIFSRTYEESCTPNCVGVSIACNGNSCPTLFEGCNHHGGLAGKKACDNVYSYCTKTATFGGPQHISCTGTGKKTLSVNSTTTVIDTHVCKTITMQFKNNTKVWNYIQNI